MFRHHIIKNSFLAKASFVRAGFHRTTPVFASRDNEGSVSAGNSAFVKRERAQEEMYFRERQRQKIEALRKELAQRERDYKENFCEQDDDGCHPIDVVLGEMYIDRFDVGACHLKKDNVERAMDARETSR
jgi:hypothetical protein